jgi:flagellin-like hook-associated protein FlgL
MSNITIQTSTFQYQMARSIGVEQARFARSLQRLGSGDRHSPGAEDLGSLSMSIKIASAARRMSALRQNVDNGISFLRTQDALLGQTASIVDRISELKTMYADPTKTNADKKGYNMEYLELGKALQSLTQETFNGRSLFGTTDSDTFQVRHGDDASQVSNLTSAYLLKEDFKQIVDAGLALADLQGGLEFINVTSAASGKAVQVGGQIAKGDSFQVRITKGTESFQSTYTATDTDEASSDPVQTIRDALINTINADPLSAGLVTASDDPDATDTVVLALDGGGIEMSIEVSNSSTQGSMDISTTQANVVELTVEAADVQADYVYALDIDGASINTDPMMAGASDEDLRDAFVSAINAAGMEVTAVNGSSTNSLVLTADSSTPGSTPINPDNIRITNATPGTTQNTVSNVVGVAQVDRITVTGGTASTTQQDQVAITAGSLDAASEYSIQLDTNVFTVTEGVDFIAATATADDIATALSTKITGVDVTVSGNALTLTSQVAGTGSAYTLSASSTDTGGSLAATSVVTAQDADTLTATLDGTILTTEVGASVNDSATALKAALEADATIAANFTITDNSDGTLDIEALSTGTAFSLATSGTGTATASSVNDTAPVTAVAREDSITLLERRISSGDTVSISIDGTTYTSSDLAGGESLSDVRDALLTAIQSGSALVDATTSGTGGVQVQAQTAGTSFTISGLAITSDSAGEVLLSSGVSIQQEELLQLASDNTGQYAPGDTLQISINGQTATVTTTANQTVDEMRDELVTEVNNLSSLDITATSAGSGELSLQSDISGQGFIVSTSVTGGDTFATTTSDAAGSGEFFSYSINAALDHITQLRAQNSSEMNRLQFAQSHIGDQIQDLHQAQGNLSGTDVAMESTQMLRAKIRTQFLATYLAQANVSQQIAFSLMTGGERPL